MDGVDEERFGGISIGPALVEALFSSTDQGFSICGIITDADGRPVDYRFIAVNSLFEKMTGLADAEGRTALELVPGLEPFWIETYGRVALDRAAQRFQSGSEPMGRWFDVFAMPVEPRGHFAIVFRDITEERRVAEERAEALARAEALLEELNHRVMNSLGMIVSIIGLEARGRGEGEGRRALERIGDRVRAVGDLYRTLGSARFETEVSADAYLGAVVERLGASLGEERGVRLLADIAPLLLPTRIAAPLGLIVTELVTNSLKYAFPDDRDGTVTVTLAEAAGTATLVVADDGTGMIPPPPDRGTGRKLVSAFARQLDGRVETCGDGGGTRVAVSFPMPAEEEEAIPVTGARLRLR
jgi:two-component sensor histidine kinase